MDVVQAEFFLPFDRTAGDRFIDGLELALTGNESLSAFKRVVRFADPGMLLPLVRQYNKYDEETDKLTQTPLPSGGLARLLRERKVKATWKRRNDTHARIAQITKRALASLPVGQIARERLDRSFRMMRPDEHHEWIESIVRCTGFWIFMFKDAPSLLFKSGNLVAHAM